jgi:hypothetical protein
MSDFSIAFSRQLLAVGFRRRLQVSGYSKNEYLMPVT